MNRIFQLHITFLNFFFFRLFSSSFNKINITNIYQIILLYIYMYMYLPYNRETIPIRQRMLGRNSI